VREGKREREREGEEEPPPHEPPPSLCTSLPSPPLTCYCLSQGAVICSKLKNVPPSAFCLRGPSGYLLVAANVGDARTVICREGTALQLSYDHKVRIRPLRIVRPQTLGREGAGYHQAPWACSCDVVAALCCALLSSLLVGCVLPLPSWQPDIDGRGRIERKNPTPTSSSCKLLPFSLIGPS